ncbi:hypothetical protein HC891_07705 [Candidatus Gracilibacteria bacterium]|nr:hypothetical protein [Candidatus Gracilibacteria bacterium]
MTAFDPGADNTVWDLALLADGSFLAAGEFFTVNGIDRAGLARFNAGGAPNLSFLAYLGGPRVFSWEDGEQDERFLVLNIVDDTLVEGDETLELELVPLPGLSLGTPARLTLTIIDNDTVSATAPTTATPTGTATATAIATTTETATTTATPTATSETVATATATATVTTIPTTTATATATGEPTPQTQPIPTTSWRIFLPLLRRGYRPRRTPSSPQASGCAAGKHGTPSITSSSPPVAAQDIACRCGCRQPSPCSPDGSTQRAVR